MKLENEIATKLKLMLWARTETWGEREINQAKAGGDFASCERLCKVHMRSGLGMA